MPKRKGGLLAALFSLASRLPWWLSLTLSPITYLLIHPLAGTAVHVPITLGKTGQLLAVQVFQIGAQYGQYVLPAWLLIGSLTARVNQAKRQRLYQAVQNSSGKAAIKGITWSEFEGLVGEWFRRQGYRVSETQPGPDGGIDLLLNRDSEIYLVQCKHWKAYKVGVNIVREHLGVMVHQGASGGYIVTSGVFTGEARRFAASSGIQLIDGDHLASMMQSVRSAAPTPLQIAPETTKSVPKCPRCNADMVERKATRGVHAGKQFWGCSNYPSCRGTSPHP